MLFWHSTLPATIEYVTRNFMANPYSKFLLLRIIKARYFTIIYVMVFFTTIYTQSITKLEHHCMRGCECWNFKGRFCCHLNAYVHSSCLIAACTTDGNFFIFRVHWSKFYHCKNMSRNSLSDKCSKVLSICMEKNLYIETLNVSIFISSEKAMNCYFVRFQYP